MGLDERERPGEDLSFRAIDRAGCDTMGYGDPDDHRSVLQHSAVPVGETDLVAKVPFGLW